MKFAKKAFTDKIEAARKASNEELAVKLEKDLEFYESNGMIAGSRPRREYSAEQQKHVDALTVFFSKAKESEMKKHSEAIIGTTFVDSKNQVTEITNVRIYFDTKVNANATKELKVETESENKIQDN